MAYAHSTVITIDHTQCGTANTSNFPLLFSVTRAYLATTSNGGEVTNANGYDIGFYSDVTLTTKLDWEVSTYTAATGQITAWVRIPTLTFATDTVIYLAWGDSGITTFQGNVNGVWDSNYKGVYHMPSSSSLSVTNSTSNSTTITLNGSPTATAGQIDGAMSLASASSQWVQLGADGEATDIGGTGAAITVECWAKLTTIASGMRVLANISASPYNGFQLLVANIGGTNKAYFEVGTASTLTNSVAATGFSTGVWAHLVGTYDGTNVRFYQLGTAGTPSANVSNALGNSNQPFVAGRWPGTPAGTYWNGQVDEIRISNVARSASYVTASYNNQKSGSTFITVGSQQTITVTTIPSAPATVSLDTTVTDTIDMTGAVPYAAAGFGPGTAGSWVSMTGGKFGNTAQDLTSGFVASATGSANRHGATTQNLTSGFSASATGATGKHGVTTQDLTSGFVASATGLTNRHSTTTQDLTSAFVATATGHANHHATTTQNLTSGFTATAVGTLTHPGAGKNGTVAQNLTSGFTATATGSDNRHGTTTQNLTSGFAASATGLQGLHGTTTQNLTSAFVASATGSANRHGIVAVNLTSGFAATLTGMRAPRGVTAQDLTSGFTATGLGIRGDAEFGIVDALLNSGFVARATGDRHLPTDRFADVDINLTSGFMASIIHSDVTPSHAIDPNGCDPDVWWGDVVRSTCDAPDVSVAQQQLAIDRAVAVVQTLTSLHYGVCTSSAVPCLTCSCSDAPQCGCWWYDRIDLDPTGSAPVARITNVIVEGVALVEDADFVVENRRWLVRVPRGTYWPVCVDPHTAPPTITITWTAGTPLTNDLLLNAVYPLAVEFAKECIGEDCALPKDVVSTVQREGVSFAVVNPAALEHGYLTGIRDVDAAVSRDPYFIGNPGSRASIIDPTDLFEDHFGGVR